MYARLKCLALGLIAVTATPALSQTPQSSPAPESAQPAAHQPAMAAAGPRVELTATAVRQVTRADTAEVALQRKQSVGKPVALMIVGGAAILVGAVIGGDVGALFMIGGAVMGLIGLYQYLQ